MRVEKSFEQSVIHLPPAEQVFMAAIVACGSAVGVFNPTCRVVAAGEIIKRAHKTIYVYNIPGFLNNQKIQGYLESRGKQILSISQPQAEILRLQNHEARISESLHNGHESFVISDRFDYLIAKHHHAFCSYKSKYDQPMGAIFGDEQTAQNLLRVFNEVWIKSEPLINR